MLDLTAEQFAQRAFDLNLEPTSTREHYGRHPLGQYLLMARRLIEAGVRLVTVTAWPGLAPGGSKRIAGMSLEIIRVGMLRKTLAVPAVTVATPP